MARKYSTEIKQELFNSSSQSEAISAIIAESKIPRSTVYAWIKDANKSKESNKTATKLFLI